MIKRKSGGQLIVFEGIDGSGKGTQIEKALEYLKKQFGEDQIVYSKDPGGTQLGLEIRELIFNKVPANTLAPGVVDCLFMASHLHNWKTIVEPALNANKIVVHDRWWYSQMAYMQFRDVPDAIKEAYDEVKGRNANLLLMFYINSDIAYKRANARMLTSSEKHQAKKPWNSENKLDEIQQTYYDLFHHLEEYRNIFVMSDATPDAVFEQVKKIIDEGLKEV